MKTRDISISGLFTALGIVLLYLGCLVPEMDMAASAAAGIVPVFVLMTASPAGGFMNYIATSVLALIILPSKTICIEYVFVFGIYPLIKLYIEKLKCIPLRALLKALISNVIILVCIEFFTELFLAPEFMTVKWKLIAALVLNACFWIYDFGMTKILYFCQSKAKLLGKKR